MDTSKLEALYQLLDEAVTLLQTDLDVSYVEALTETIQNLAYEGKAQQLDGLPTDETVAQLNRIYRKMKLDEETREATRKLIQLGFIKAIKSDKIQANHQMTPDTIAYLLAFFIDAIKTDKTEPLHIHDLAVGSGNLLMVVMDHLEKRGNTVTSEAVDNDDLLIALASNSSHLQKWGEAVTFTHSDSLQELLIRPSDLSIADLPIGYYPLDNRAEKFETAYSEGNSYAHFLLIEQHMKYLKEGGWGFFIVPKNLIESDQEGVFMKWLNNHAFLQGMLELPESLFQSEQMQKSILILQKRGNNAEQVKEVLLGTIPDIKNARKMQGFLAQFNNWAK